VTGPRRVVVVGGGLAGITAALGLANAGVHATLLERRPRLGGATSSFQRGGLTVDTGQHVFLRCCSDYRGLLRRLGVQDRVVLQDRLDVTVLAPGGARARIRRTVLPAPAHLAAAVAGYRHLTPAERARVVRGGLVLRSLDPDDSSLDTRTLGEFLGMHGQTAATVDGFWDVFVTAALNLPARRASLQLAARVFRTGLLEVADAGDLGWSRVPLGELHGDAGGRALAAAGVEVRTRVAVRGLGRSDGSSTAAGQRDPDAGGWLVHTAGAPVAGDAVVLAVPAGEAAGLLPAGAVPVPERLPALGASPIVNVHIVYDRPVLPLPFVAAIRSPVQWVFDRTRPSGLTEGQYLAVSLSAADDWVDRPTEEVRSVFLPALAELLPKARSARVREFFVTRERRATFRQGVGSSGLRLGASTALPGLLLAGAWTDTGWPDTMESAVRSGRSAVRAVLDHLTRAAPARGSAA
jgi:squalene-associated FAD-dependent desaturase